MDTTVPRGCIEGKINPPSSKSYAQRALACSLLAEGTSHLLNIELCSDALSAIECIKALGAKVEKDKENSLRIVGGLSPISDTLYVGESGLSARLFTPIASLWNAPITIQGEGTLRFRPMTMMIEPLRALGVELRDNGGLLPFTVRGPLGGGDITVDGSVSSQFITGLLLALPLSKEDTTIHVNGAVSTPYIDMTIKMANSFGVRIERNGYEEFFVEGDQKYIATQVNLEGDWSAAATMLVAGAIAGSVKVENISMLSSQADVAICDALIRCGAELISENDSVTVSKKDLRPFEFDATNCPDLFPALVALAAAIQGESRIKGIGRLSHKESDRAEVLRTEYAKLGVRIELSEEEDTMSVWGCDEIEFAEVDSWHDHRIAMSLAVTALRSKNGLLIHDSECVSKSYPRFFEDLASLRVDE
ncbi:MAG: 3-phosphoshikimate 1-carboxyvinyltransferase [Alistipes sp.]|nr:3-phosphoshikimate 1-carboxyvinyltransferase [Candidatus Alistipes equi]